MFSLDAIWNIFLALYVLKYIQMGRYGYDNIILRPTIAYVWDQDMICAKTTTLRAKTTTLRAKTTTLVARHTKYMRLDFLLLHYDLLQVIENAIL